MADHAYPTSLAELDTWRIRHGTTSDESRKRFTQYVILEAIANGSGLATTLSFKGGNALRFVYGNRRTTIDLDFTASSDFPDDPATIRGLMNPALANASAKFGIALRCQRVRRDPPNPQRTFPTYTIKVGYQFPADPYFAGYMTSDRMVSNVVELEISLNDVVCATTPSRPMSSAQGEIRVQVCALEDILAEKLRALLQQPIRNRNRRQDVYDIARMIQLHGESLDRRKIGDYLLRKAAARNVAVRRSAFNQEVKRLAAFEYENLFSTIDPDFIPFEAGWSAVLRLVDELSIPD